MTILDNHAFGESETHIHLEQKLKEQSSMPSTTNADQHTRSLTDIEALDRGTEPAAASNGPTVLLVGRLARVVDDARDHLRLANVRLLEATTTAEVRAAFAADIITGVHKTQAHLGRPDEPPQVSAIPLQSRESATPAWPAP